jgi:hypothetical protein
VSARVSPARDLQFGAELHSHSKAPHWEGGCLLLRLLIGCSAGATYYLTCAVALAVAASKHQTAVSQPEPASPVLPALHMLTTVLQVPPTSSASRAELIVL